MRAGIESAAKAGGVKKITAANYGGALGNVRIYLKELF
jgi:formylmethanofuran:tetrahydromethanopterin formyltransferase